MHITFIPRGLVRRGLVAAVALAAAGVATGGPLTTHAADIDNCGPNLAMTCVGVVESVSANGNPAVAVASCTATVSSEVVAVAAGVKCWLIDTDTGNSLVANSTRELWLPGTASTTAIDLTGLASDHYQVCVEGGYVTVFGSVNDVANPVCSAIIV